MERLPTGAVILIPSLEPDDRLPAYVQRLHEQGFDRIVIVDDGSSAAYQPIFERIEAMDGCTVLHHEVNRGKGCALKTGYTYIRDHMPDVTGVITADADGQHTVEDCLKLAEALREEKKVLYLGSRDFNLPNIPPKSRFGNKTTSGVFWALYGQWLPDTQTGLRAFRREELDFMIEVPGDRFEYEMQVLIACARASIPMIPLTIETVYENENAGTHFHPIRDSWRIYKVILGSFFKFMGASIASFVVDQGLAALLAEWLLPLLALSAGSIVWLSGLIARLFSSVFNFMLNRSFVFKLKGSAKKAVWRYAALCVLIICLSNTGVWLLGRLGLSRWIAKLICDTLLYFLSFRVQNKWVFKEDNP